MVDNVVREKVKRHAEYKEVVYDAHRWKLLSEKRAKALKIIRGLAKYGVQAFIHGSVARGDVNEGSDVDVVVLDVIPSYIIELALEELGCNIYSKMIVQATPMHTPKAYYVLDPYEEVVVSFPLAKFLPREYEFYKWGGMLDPQSLERDVRVPGVNKELVLIEPTPRGHRESPVIGREEEVASILGISVETVRERVRILTRRDEIGRTGVYMKVDVALEECVEDVLRRLANNDPKLRRVLKERGL